jgi:redox-sensitive bicupin YhaK (pirin superfamily)
VSGPLEELNEGPQPGLGEIEIKEGRVADVGGIGVLRVLPTKKRRTVGPWCFVDLMHPSDVAEPPPIEIGPHPHIGLATATWLFDGSVVHTDSLGTEQLIRPGELNLMTAGRGIAHAELGVEAPAVSSGILGAQMWIAQPDGTRDGAHHFEHHADLPLVDVPRGSARVIVGSFGGVTSQAGVDHPAIGLDVTFEGSIEIALDPIFEQAVVPVDRTLKVQDALVELGSLALVPAGYQTLRVEERAGSARMLLIGGVPFGAEIKMWWNFVARTLDEITEAWRAWKDHDDDRFGPVASKLGRVEAPTPPWIRGVDAR